MVGQLGQADPLADVDGEAFLDAVLALENKNAKRQIGRPEHKKKESTNLYVSL